MAVEYAPLFPLETQFQAKDGRNNTGGFLRVFLAATDTPADTYKDYNGTRNPENIVLDSNGRAVVICDKDRGYRLEVYDANGTLLWTEEPVFCTGTGGGGVLSGTVVESTDGTVGVTKTTVGSLTYYDLSTSIDENTEPRFVQLNGQNEYQAGNAYMPLTTVVDKAEWAHNGGFLADHDCLVDIDANIYAISNSGTELDYVRVSMFVFIDNVQKYTTYTIFDRTMAVGSGTSLAWKGEVKEGELLTVKFWLMPGAPLSAYTIGADVFINEVSDGIIGGGGTASGNTIEFVTTSDNSATVRAIIARGNLPVLKDDYQGTDIQYEPLCRDLPGVNKFYFGRTEYEGGDTIYFCGHVLDGATDMWSGYGRFLATTDDLSGKIDKVTGASGGEIALVNSDGSLTTGPHVSSLAYTGMLMAYQPLSGMSAYAYESSNSAKLDASASAGFYPMTGNPSGFLTGVDLSPYQPVSAMSGYMPYSSLEYDASSAISGIGGSAIAQQAASQSVTYITTANTVQDIYGIVQNGGLPVLMSGDGADRQYFNFVANWTSEYGWKAFSRVYNYAGQAYADWAFVNIDGWSSTSWRLDNVQADWSVSSTGNPAYIKNKPDLTQYQTTADMSGYATTGDIAGKLDNSASGDFYPMTGNPSGFLTNVDLSDYATTSQLADKQDASAMTAYATVDDLVNKQDVSGMSAYATTSWVYNLNTAVRNDLNTVATNTANIYGDLTGLSSTVSGLTGTYLDTSASSMFASSSVETSKLDASASSLFYSTSNPSGFITGVPADTMSTGSLEFDNDGHVTAYGGSAFAGYDADVLVQTNSAIWNSASAITAYQPVSAMSGYATTGDLANKQDASAMSGYIPTSVSSTFLTSETVTAIGNNGAYITSINGSAISGVGGGADYTGVSPVIVDNDARTISVAYSGLAVDNTMTAYTSGNDIVLGVSTAELVSDGFLTSQTVTATAGADGYVTSINGSGLSGAGGDYVEKSASAITIGSGNTANGVWSLAAGRENSASSVSFVQGTYNTAGSYSDAIGSYNFASSYSMALVNGCTAKSNSFAVGNRLSACNTATAFGKWNKLSDGATDADNVALVIGDGINDNNRHDLLAVTKDGEITTYSSTADTTGFPIVSNVTALKNTVSTNSASWAAPAFPLEISTGSTAKAVVTTGFQDNTSTRPTLFISSNPSQTAYPRMLLSENRAGSVTNKSSTYLADAFEFYSAANSTAAGTKIFRADPTVISGSQLTAAVGKNWRIGSAEYASWNAKLDSSAATSYALSADVSATVDTVATQSANWGKGNDETVLWSGMAYDTAFSGELSEPPSAFREIKVYTYPAIEFSSQRVPQVSTFAFVTAATNNFLYVHTDYIASNKTYQEVIYLNMSQSGFILTSGSRWSGTTFTSGITGYLGGVGRVIGVGRIS